MSWIINWIRRQESRCIKQWLTDIYFELADGRQLSLTAGPRVDVDLNQIWSSNEIAERYLKLSPVFVITNQGEVVPRAQIKRIQKLNRLEPTTWCRWVWLGFFRTRWRRKIDKPIKVC